MQMACLLCTSKSEFTLNFVDVHKQTGSNDCDLFSNAYAVLLCLGENPGSLVYDYPKMCSHLSSCIILNNNVFLCYQSEAKEEKSESYIN